MEENEVVLSDVHISTSYSTVNQYALSDHDLYHHADQKVLDGGVPEELQTLAVTRFHLPQSWSFKCDIQTLKEKGDVRQKFCSDATSENVLHGSWTDGSFKPNKMEKHSAAVDMDQPGKKKRKVSDEQNRDDGDCKLTAVQEDEDGDCKLTAVQEDKDEDCKLTAVQKDKDGVCKLTAVPEHEDGDGKLTAVPEDEDGYCKLTAVQEDEDGDCKLTAVQEDEDGDCKLTAVQADEDGDCKLTAVQEDEDADCKLTAVQEDEDGDCKLTAVQEDEDGDCKLTAVQEDEDCKLTTVQEDEDGDCKLTAVQKDEDGDGKLTAVQEDEDGDCKLTAVQDDEDGDCKLTAVQDDEDGDCKLTAVQDDEDGDCKLTAVQDDEDGDCKLTAVQDDEDGDCKLTAVQEDEDGDCKLTAVQEDEDGDCKLTAVQEDEDGDLLLERPVKIDCDYTCALTIVHHLATKRDDVGHQVWSGALLLCEYILANEKVFRDHVVLDLGCGVGLTSIVTAMCAKQVFCTDVYQSILKLAQYNARVNSHLYSKTNNDSSRVKVRHLDWMKEFPSKDCQSCPDEFHWTAADLEELKSLKVLIAADVVYDEDLTEGFFRTFHHFMLEPPEKVLYLSLEKRLVFSVREIDVVSPAYDNFQQCLKDLDLCKDNGLQYHVEQLDTDFPQCFQYI